MAQSVCVTFPHRSQELIDGFGNKAIFDFTSLETGVVYSKHPGSYNPTSSLPPAILQSIKRDGTLNVVNVPESRLPSPLGNMITPGTLLKLKEYLVGKGNHEVRVGGGRAGNGLEVWKSWKRAYDIWNNFYIEGRVDPEWVKERWAEKAPQRKAEEQDRWNTRKDDHDNGTKRSFHWSQSLLRAPHGGALNDLKIFTQDIPDDSRNNDIPHHGYDTSNFDKVQNSVWMPRRIGEEALLIDYDEYVADGIESYYKNSDLEVDGGVDCGRFPYPALRSLIQYTSTDVQFPDTAAPLQFDETTTIVKKNTWDGVRSTIYNMPVLSTKAPGDPELDMIRNIYSDSIRDVMNGDGSMFPLHIHRVMKVLPTVKDQLLPDKLKEVIPLLPDGQKLLLPRDETSGQSLIVSRKINSRDPWYVDEEQRKLQKYPPRRWPPVENVEDNDLLLPVDDTLIVDEYNKDYYYHAQYFVTNIHGGDLFINGMQVPKGAVAGPLPRFALIETPGGQVSWWFGVHGRCYTPEKSYGTEVINDTRKWQTLRSIPGWQYTGMKSAEVWDIKMDDRAVRERTGNDNNDDEEWACWKNGYYHKSVGGGALALGTQHVTAKKRSELYPPPIGSPHTLRSFSDSNSELKYAYTLAALPTEKVKHINLDSQLIQPTKQPSLWPGAKRVERTAEHEAFESVDKIWPITEPRFRVSLESRQQKWANDFRQAKQADTARREHDFILRQQSDREADFKKRKAASIEEDFSAKRQKEHEDVAERRMFDKTTRKRKAEKDALDEFENKRRRLENTTRVAANKTQHPLKSLDQVRVALQGDDKARYCKLEKLRQNINTCRRAFRQPEIPPRDLVNQLYHTKPNAWAPLTPPEPPAAKSRTSELVTMKLSEREINRVNGQNAKPQPIITATNDDNDSILLNPALNLNAVQLEHEFAALPTASVSTYRRSYTEIGAEDQRVKGAADLRKDSDGNEKRRDAQRAPYEMHGRTQLLAQEANLDQRSRKPSRTIGKGAAQKMSRELEGQLAKYLSTGQQHQCSRVNQYKPAKLRQIHDEFRNIAHVGSTAQARVDHGLELTNEAAREEHLRAQHFVGTWDEYIQSQVDALNFTADMVPTMDRYVAQSPEMTVAQKRDEMHNNALHRQYVSIKHDLRHDAAQTEVSKYEISQVAQLRDGQARLSTLVL